MKWTAFLSDLNQASIFSHDSNDTIHSQTTTTTTTTTPWLYSPCRTLATFTTIFQSSLLCARILQFVTPILLRSSLTSSVHLNLGLPTLLLPSGVFWHNLFTTLSSLILSTCPSPLNLFLFLLLCPILHIIASLPHLFCSSKVPQNPSIESWYDTCGQTDRHYASNWPVSGTFQTHPKSKQCTSREKRARYIQSWFRRITAQWRPLPVETSCHRGPTPSSNDRKRPNCRNNVLYLNTRRKTP